jgi:hypothetical protein
MNGRLPPVGVVAKAFLMRLAGASGHCRATWKFPWLSVLPTAGMWNQEKLLFD